MQPTLTRSPRCCFATAAPGLNRWVIGCPFCFTLVLRDEADRQTLVQKVVDDTIYLKRPAAWSNAQGRSLAGPGRGGRQSLVYVTPAICGADNGRVVGYDNSHNHHHRHFMGKQEPFEFTGYEALVRRFYDEVRDLWRSKDQEQAP
jgi:hypothetical protein